MKKLDNAEIAQKVEVQMQQQCGPSTNCAPNGCSCSKCFDSTSNTSKEIKKIYSK